MTGVQTCALPIYAVMRMKQLCRGSVSEAITGTIVLGVVYICSNSQAALVDTNVHVDAVHLYKENTKMAFRSSIENYMTALHGF